MKTYHIIQGDGEEFISSLEHKFALIYLNPPFNQGKEYYQYNDNLPEKTYWEMMYQVAKDSFQKMLDGGTIYFMQRDKNVGKVIAVLTRARFTIQSVIIWKKMTSAVPQKYRYGKNYQIIVFATKGERPRVFNRL